MDAFQMVLVAVSLGAAMFAVGVLVAEWKMRAKLAGELKSATFEMRETVARVSAVHSLLVKQVSQIHDDFQLLREGG